MLVTTVGLQIMHNGRAIELLYKIGDQVDGTQLWMVKPLFVSDDRPYERAIKTADRCSRLHTQSAA